MAGIKISELPEASCVLGDELIAIVQGSCTKFAPASAIGSTGSNDITSILAGDGLEGGGSAGAVVLSLDSNCLDRFEGTNTTLASTSACWDSTYTTVQTTSSNWNTAYTNSTDLASCPGLNCIGDVTTSDLNGVVLTTGNQTIAGRKSFTDSVDACELRALDNSDTEIALGSGAIIGFGCSAGAQCMLFYMDKDGVCFNPNSRPGQDFTVVSDNSNCAFYVNAGDDGVAVGTCNTADALFTVAGSISAATTRIGGMACAVETKVGSDHDFGFVGGEILSGGDNYIVGGADNRIGEVATELRNSGTIGGTGNVINGGTNSVIIGGVDNCLCENTIFEPSDSKTIIGSVSSCIDGECSGIYSAFNANIDGCNSVIVGGFDHSTLCGCGYIFGGTCNVVNGTHSTAVGGCCNCSGTFLNSRTITVGGACNCALGNRSAVVGGWKVQACGDDSATVGGCCNSIGDNAHTSVIAGGCGNAINGADCYSFIGGGQSITIGQDNSGAVAGNNICVDTIRSFVGGGNSQTIDDDACNAGIIGGQFNTIDNDGLDSVVVGGNTNCITVCRSFLAGGVLNKVCGAGIQSAVIGGCSNNAIHESSVIAGATNMTTVSGSMLHAKTLFLDACTLPGSDPGVSGVVWNDNGTLKISV